MGQITRDTVDRESTIDPDLERSPGLLVVAAAALAFAVCVANFALGQAGAGVASAIVAMLAFGAGLSWLGMDRRGIRQAERDGVIAHERR